MAELTDEQQERLEELCATLCQGDLVRTPVLAVVGSPAATTHDGTKHAISFAELGQVVVERRLATGLWAIVSQTCDIRRDPTGEPFLLLAPVLDVAEVEWWAAEGGVSSARRFAYPRRIGDLEHPVLDVRIVQTLEKHALADQRLRPQTDALTPPLRARLSTFLARRFGRAAFPDWLEQHVLGRLRDEVKRRTGKPGTPAGALLACREAILIDYGDGAGVRILVVVRADTVLADPVLKGDQDETRRAAEQLLRPVIRAANQAGIAVTGEVAAAEAIPWADVLYRFRRVDVEVP